jgi:hypothetical protein
MGYVEDCAIDAGVLARKISLSQLNLRFLETSLVVYCGHFGERGIEELLLALSAIIMLLNMLC